MLVYIKDKSDFSQIKLTLSFFPLVHRNAFELVSNELTFLSGCWCTKYFKGQEPFMEIMFPQVSP